MFDFYTVTAFSHRHCIEICAFLVPANLLATLQTIIFTGIKRSQLQVHLGAAVGSIYALIMILHVFTWLAIGVVMAPTYILFLLGSICLGTNIWAVVHSSSMSRLVESLFQFLLRNSSANFALARVKTQKRLTF
ncbi:hypothetical protein [Kamptonema sp. UHCC 0994]|uniref:hypothetical protein n=1 Tax=Kamptonema sp. UHCC 0994 TaxID=3031329 RepID=UPI0023B9F80D|nr:hypothetical protein [Kamptonema sp. UHCC 0994]